MLMHGIHILYIIISDVDYWDACILIGRARIWKKPLNEHFNSQEAAKHIKCVSFLKSSHHRKNVQQIVFIKPAARVVRKLKVL